MKKLKYISMAVAAVAVASCSLDETNYSTIDTEVAYTSETGYNGLINACYENLYYLYGKTDGIGPMEMGTDLWKIGSRDGGNGELTNNNSNLTTQTGVLRTCWNALYATIGYCNTALYYQYHSDGFTADQIKAKAAEARFMRAFSYFHIVEQWGGVVLDTVSFATTGVPAEMCYRSPEEDFYKVIISDLKIAVNDLPATQGERGRVTKKAALAMLAKAYMQRTRLYDKGSSEYVANADSAWMCATELIDNASAYDCGLYASTADRSGNSIAWDDENNKDNDEFLFIEAVDHANGYNPEGWNRGRTRQYYMMSISSQAQYFGIQASGIRYGRDNAKVWSPTYWLLHECFDPRQQKSIPDFNNGELQKLAKNPNDFTPDTRFEDAFYYKYYSAMTVMLSNDVATRYKKNITEYEQRDENGDIVKDENGNPVMLPSPINSIAKRRIANAGMKGSELDIQFPGLNYYASGAGAGNTYEREDVDDALGVFTPNWELDTLKTCLNKRLCLGITDYFNTKPESDDMDPEYTYFRNTFPSFKKFSCFKYAYTNQYVMCDIPIIRLTDIYLIAAEAALAKGVPAEGLPYLNAVRRHAARSGDAAEMEVSDYDLDFLVKERARELCGEQWRWYDLKRMGYLRADYLVDKHKNPYISFEEKNLVRPIPQEFLDQIANADEFGTNGY